MIDSYVDRYILCIQRIVIISHILPFIVLGIISDIYIYFVIKVLQLDLFIVHLLLQCK